MWARNGLDKATDGRGETWCAVSLLQQESGRLIITAPEAKQLNVGDIVTATFSGRGYVKRCEIIGISWPWFTLKTTTSKGVEMVRMRRYRSLGIKCEPDGARPVSLPSWLVWPSAV